MNEDWDILKSLLPENWRELAKETDALKGLRQDKSPDNYLRLLLHHFGGGFSLRETVAHARLTGLADMSDVALYKRVVKSEEWLRRMCEEMSREVFESANDDTRLRIVDATIVREPGPSGSQWRIHYSVNLPSMRCDHFAITDVAGKGTRESLQHFPIAEGDHLIADRGYCSARGIEHVIKHNADITVRLHSSAVPLYDEHQQKIDLLKRVRTMGTTRRPRSWKVWIKGNNASMIPLRLCIVKKSNQAAEATREAIRKNASKKQTITKEATKEFAGYFMILTSTDATTMPLKSIFKAYAMRWQVELVFKRFKSLAQMGHIPKYRPDSAKAWLYGKLLIAFLTEKLIDNAMRFSPWGYHIDFKEQPVSKHVERV